MPTVPELSAPTVQEEPLPGRPYPRFDENVPQGGVGPVGAAGLEALSSDVGAVQAKEKAQADQLRVIDANTQLEDAKVGLQYGQKQSDGTYSGGAFSVHGADAVNLPDKLLPVYDQAAAKIASTLTPDQQRMFAQHVAAGRNELNLSLNRYEYEEHNRIAAGIYKDGVEQTVENASVGYRDPAQLAKARGDLATLTKVEADRQGIPQDDPRRAQMLQSSLANLHYNVIDRMLADGNPNNALAYFKAIRDTNELTGEQSKALGAEIDSAFREHQAALQTDVATRVKDVRTAAINGMVIPPSQMPSEASIRAAFPDTATQIIADMHRDIQMGSDLKSMAGMTPQQLNDEVEKYKPTGVAGAAEGFERYNAVRSAAAQVIASRAADPRQYMVDNKLGSQPLDFSDLGKVGTEINSRIASTDAQSRQLGGYIPPLTRGESAELGQRLETMTPADRLRTLAALHGSIQDERGYQELMRQVLPGSPVTAIVGSQVGNADPNRAPFWFDHNFVPSPQDQTRILTGEQLLNPKGDEKSGQKGKPFPMPPDEGSSGLRTQFANKVGDLFRDRPQLFSAYFGAFKDAYAALLSEKGDYSGNGSGSLRNQAIQIAVGQVHEINGGNVAVPIGMDPTRFEGVLNDAIAAQAKATGAPADWQRRISGYKLNEVGGLGSGRYELLNGNMPLVRPDGAGKFIVDLRQPPGAPTAAAPTAQPPEVPGYSGVARGDIVRQPTFKPPPASLGHGARGSSSSGHPSQGPAEPTT